MFYTFGRNNLALTVFVPWDCGNNCFFCTSKQKYSAYKADLKNLRWQLDRFFKEYDFPVKDVVFSGGEPMANVEALEKLIELVPSDKRIFVNTTFTRTGRNEFLHLIKNGRITGVNVSRHHESYAEDCEWFFDLADDSEIDDISCQVRINCVLKNQNIARLVERWKGKNVVLNLRCDYRTMTKERLHDPYDMPAMELMKMGYRFERHTQCNVCDTTHFAPPDETLPHVMYHKGLRESSILSDDLLEINDFIIDQSGRLMYDWDHTDLELLQGILVQARKIDLSRNAYLSNATIAKAINENRFVCGGHSGCGGSGC